MDQRVRAAARRVTPGPLRSAVRSGLGRYRLARGPTRGRDRALADEIAFWDRWLARNQEELESRLCGEMTRHAVRECLTRVEDGEVSIIDVGSGPLTTLGTKFPGKQVKLVAVDPLATEYEALLERRGVEPPVRPIPCAGEELLDRFAPESFDIAFSENALDHAVDPLRVIRNMIGVVKAGGFVVLDHGENTGYHAAYGQLHHWNFDEREGRCVLWRGGVEWDLGGEVSELATVECRREPRPPKPRDRIVCILQKHNPPDPADVYGEISG